LAAGGRQTPVQIWAGPLLLALSLNLDIQSPETFGLIGGAVE